MTSTPDLTMTASAEVAITQSALATSEYAYLDSILVYIDEAAAAEREIKFQLDLLDIDATLFTDADWLDDLDRAVAQYEAALQGASGITPPDSLAGVHQSVLDAMTECNAGYHLMADGARDQDADTLDDALAKITRCKARVAQANHELELWIDGLP